MSVNGATNFTDSVPGIGDTLTTTSTNNCDPLQHLTLSAMMQSGSSSRNKAIVVLGAQWGDEGKGKLIDILANDFDVVCRSVDSSRCTIASKNVFQSPNLKLHNKQTSDKVFYKMLMFAGKWGTSFSIFLIIPKKLRRVKKLASAL